MAKKGKEVVGTSMVEDFSEDGTKPSGSNKKKGDLTDEDLDHTPTGTETTGHRTDFAHIEKAIEEKQKKETLWQKTKKHFMRFWLWYLIGLIIFLAILLPLLFLKIIPALAQLIVDKTSLPIKAATLAAVTNDKVLVGIHTELEIPAGIKVKLDPFELNLYNKETEGFYPFAGIWTDDLTAEGKTDVVIRDQTVAVRNRTELHRWLSGMLRDKETEISVKGKAKAHLGKLKFNLNFQKTIPLSAQYNFKGFNLAKLNLILPAREDGTNIAGNVMLPNWGDLIIGLGDLTFNLHVAGLTVGFITMPDVTLRPGNQTVPMTGQVYLPVIMSNITDIFSNQTQAISQGNIDLTITGNSTKIDGEHITYLERVLSTTTLPLQLPIFQLITDIGGSVLSGDSSIGGLLNAVGEGIGPLLDGVLGGGNGTDGDGGEGGSGSILDDMLNNWNGDTEDGGESNDDGGDGDGGNGDGGGGNGDSPISGILDGLGMRSEVAKRSFIRAMEVRKRR